MLLLLGFILAQPSFAETVSCEAMPCCTGAAPAEPKALDCCEAEALTECGCALGEDRTPSSEPSKALLFLQNFEAENKELILLVFEDEMTLRVEEKPEWFEPDHNFTRQEVTVYSAFPNPPPHCS